MSLSKISIQNAFYGLMGNYFSAIYSDPIRTKCLTSCILASCGNVTSQIIAGKNFDWNNLRAFSLFGLLFGGTLPHFFFLLLDKLISKKSSYAGLKRLLLERFLYAPFFQFFSLYMLSRLEGKSHEVSYDKAEKLFPSVLRANWKYLSVVQFVNLTFVPSMLRVLIVNFIGFFWTIYLATKRRQTEN